MHLGSIDEILSGMMLMVLSKTDAPRLSKLGSRAGHTIGKRLQRHKGQICRLVLAWTKEGMTYALALDADWWSRIEDQLETDRLEKRVIVEARNEEKLIKSLVAQSVKSFAKSRTYKVTQAEIERFLDLKGVSLSYPAVRQIWGQVNERIRNRSSVDRTKAHNWRW